MIFLTFNTFLSLDKYTDIIRLDTPEPWGLFFQDNATPQMEGLEELHNNIMYYLAITLFAVSWIMVSIIINYKNAKIPNKYLNHGTLAELIWTITPALILILIAFPSFKLLYLMDEVIDPSLVIYGEGHQWYWSYQYPDFINDNEEQQWCFSGHGSGNTLEGLGDEVPSSSRQAPTGDNPGRNTILQHNDCLVKPRVYDKQIDSLEIRVSSYPWAEVFNNPVKHFFPHLSSDTVAPRQFHLSVGSEPRYPRETYFQGRCGDGIDENEGLWKAVEEKSKTVKDLRDLYDQEFTSNRLAEVRATRASLVSRRVNNADAAWQLADPHGYNLLKELRVLRALESGLKVTDPTYISRVSRFPFET